MTKIKNRNFKKIIWFFVEGKKTEYNYFKGLQYNFNKQNKDFKIKVEFLVSNFTKKDIEKKIINKFEMRGIFERDKIFLVFDGDEKKENELDKMVNICKKNNLKIIFSNPCFEYWFLCHFGNFPQNYDINGVKTKFKEEYNKRFQNEIDIYENLNQNLNFAIKNSKRIFKKKKISMNSNPYTNLYEIYDYLKKL